MRNKFALVYLLASGRAALSWGKANLELRQNFYERLRGGTFLKAVSKYVKMHYDYVLIDSRTGVSDTSGICTVHMPDSLVICFTLNRQSIDGAAGVAWSVLSQRDEIPIRILPIPTRVEDGEKVKRDAAKTRAQQKFAPILGFMNIKDVDAYWASMEVPYKQFYAYEEILATFGDKHADLDTVLGSAERLTSRITNSTVNKLVPASEEDRSAMLDRFEWSTKEKATQKSYAKPVQDSRAAHSPGDKYDIFISYSRNDNVAIGAEPGWVEAFHNDLENWLIKRRGLSYLKIWRDTFSLQENDVIDEPIEDAVRHSKLLFALNSHNYLKSKYCGSSWLS